MGGLNMNNEEYYFLLEEEYLNKCQSIARYWLKQEIEEKKKPYRAMNFELPYMAKLLRQNRMILALD